MIEHLVALALATAVLVAIPGPNVALIVANSLRFGFAAGVWTVLGTTAGVALQLLLVVIGMAAIIEFAGHALSWVRWAGVAYLVYLGIRSWRETADDLRDVAPARTVFWRGCGLAAVNPKTLLFNAAFLPQFIPGGAATAFDIALVGGVFISVLLAGDLLWAAFASSAGSVLQRYGNWRNRLTGGFLVAAGLGLAAARKAEL